jgi:putative methyltransferase (TIGR04325 family)
VRNRNLVNKFIPPIIIIIIKEFVLRFRSNFIKTNVYNSSVIATFVAQQNLLYKEDIKNNIFLELENYRLLAAVGLAITQNNGKPITVVDFGGGGGGHYFVAKKIFNDAIAKWIIIETDEMVHANKLNTDNILEFFSKISSVPENTKVDLVFSSSAFQYTDNPKKIVNDLACLDPQIFFFTKTSLSTCNEIKIKTEYSKLSGNGPALNTAKNRRSELISYTAYSMPKFEVESILSSNFKLIYEINEGIPNGYRLTDHVNLFGMCWEKLI